MLTRTQAETIADELLGQRRRADTDAKNAAARRVPFAYRVPGLDALEPWERAQLVGASAKQVGNQWRPVVVTIGLVCATSVAWWLAGMFSRPGASPLAFVFLCGAVIYLPRAYFVRREIHKRLDSARPRISPGTPLESK